MSVVNFRILENRVSRLQGHLQRLQQQTSANQNCQLDTTHLNSLYEDLHWLVLITSKSPGENSLNCNLWLWIQIWPFKKSTKSICNFIDSEETIAESMPFPLKLNSFDETGIAVSHIWSQGNLSLYHDNHLPSKHSCTCTKYHYYSTIISSTMFSQPMCWQRNVKEKPPWFPLISWTIPLVKPRRLTCPPPWRFWHLPVRV